MKRGSAARICIFSTLPRVTTILFLDAEGKLTSNRDHRAPPMGTSSNFANEELTCPLCAVLLFTAVLASMTASASAGAST